MNLGQPHNEYRLDNYWHSYWHPPDRTWASFVEPTARASGQWARWRGSVCRMLPPTAVGGVLSARRGGPHSRVENRDQDREEAATSEGRSGREQPRAKGKEAEPRTKKPETANTGTSSRERQKRTYRRHVRVGRHARRALALVEFLRANCPWDRKQTAESLIPYLVEESQEVVDAIRAGDSGNSRGARGPAAQRGLPDRARGGGPGLRPAFAGGTPGREDAAAASPSLRRRRERGTGRR